MGGGATHRGRLGVHYWRRVTCLHDVRVECGLSQVGEGVSELVLAWSWSRYRLNQERFDTPNGSLGGRTETNFPVRKFNFPMRKFIFPVRKFNFPVRKRSARQ